MEDSYSVNSPRRVLSLSKKRRAILSFHDQDDKGFGFQPLEERGLKSSEVYGFVGSITTIVATAIFFVWAYVPEPWLHSIGIYYYPSRYWALAAPIYTIMAIVLGLLFYIGLNFMSTPPPTSLNTIYDEFSREPSDLMHSMEEEVQLSQAIISYKEDPQLKSTDSSHSWRKRNHCQESSR